jgi:hypothetical protein
LNLQILSCEAEFLAAFGTIATMALYGFARRFQLDARIERLAAL